MHRHNFALSCNHYFLEWETRDVKDDDDDFSIERVEYCQKRNITIVFNSF